MNKKDQDIMHIKMAIGFGEKSATEVLWKLNQYPGYESKSYSWLKKYTLEIVTDGHVTYEMVNGHYKYRIGRVW